MIGARSVNPVAIHFPSLDLSLGSCLASSASNRLDVMEFIADPRSPPTADRMPDSSEAVGMHRLPKTQTNSRRGQRFGGMSCGSRTP